MGAVWLRRVLRWVERLLFLAGVVALSWVYLTWKEAVFYQIRARGQLKEMAAARPTPPGAVRPTTGVVGDHADPLIGYLAIPRLGLSVPILEGDVPGHSASRRVACRTRHFRGRRATAQSPDTAIRSFDL